MKILKTAVCAALLAAGATTLTATAADSTRDQRMEDALQNYRSSPGRDTTTTTADMNRRDSQAGPVERTQRRATEGTKRAMGAVERGVKRAGNAVARGADKATGAVRRTGERMGGSNEAAQRSNAATQ